MGSRVAIASSLLSCVFLLLETTLAFQIAPGVPFSRSPLGRTSFTTGKSVCAAPRFLQAATERQRLQRSKQTVRELQAALDAAVLAPALSAVSGTVTKFSGIAVLCGVVAFHEAGHFLAAKVQGIRVNDFCIGFGPKLFAFKDNDGVEYSLRALPLGGYVSFPEAINDNEKGKEDSEESQENDSDQVEIRDDDPDLIQNRPAFQRAIVISGGVIFNMLLAWMALFGSVSTNGITNVALNPGVTIPAIADANGAGAKYGLKQGDIILKVDDVLLGAAETTSTQVSAAIKSSHGKTVHMVIEREKQQYELDVVPNVDRRGDGVIGVRLGPNVKSVQVVKAESIGAALGETNKRFGSLFTQTLKGFGDLFANLGATAGNLAGPVGVMQMGNQAQEQGALLAFTALISINLGLMNSLPLPALDGGQLLLVMVEAVRGRPLNQEVTRTVNGVFLTALLGISLSLLLSDIERLIPASFLK